MSKTGKEIQVKKKKSKTKSLKAGLKFPVGRIHRFLKNNLTSQNRVSSEAAVYTAAILEYLTSEVLELSSLISTKKNIKRITPRHLCLAIRGDTELDCLTKATIRGGGVNPDSKIINKTKG